MKSEATHLTRKKSQKVPDRSDVSMGRHEFHCTICRHPQRSEIEQDWVNWGKPSRIARQYHVSRDSVYRHAQAVGLFSKRQRGTRKAVEPIIEQEEKNQLNAHQPRRGPESKLMKAQNKNRMELGSPESRVAPRIVRAFGTSDSKVVLELLNQVEFALPGGRDALRHKCEYAVSTLEGIKPGDQLEGLLALQMVATHTLAMQFMGRAMDEDQTVEGVDRNVKRSTKLLSLFVAQMDALNRHRGKGEQKVIVKHVHVHEGGQAIVGAVSQTRPGGGGSDTKN